MAIKVTTNPNTIKKNPILLFLLKAQFEYLDYYNIFKESPARRNLIIPLAIL